MPTSSRERLNSAVSVRYALAPSNVHVKLFDGSEFDPKAVEGKPTNFRDKIENAKALVAEVKPSSFAR